ncbi:ABC transporter ATP-binding protein [Candidatus Geothermarchaeota archaeon]|nr:MAG: ABC transporter ATP-binding protein [Candidatus Geothermarchaeota archaeon]HEW93699.1 ABC transporter ATP-binding protein [Thermoprotei archaeon]
MHLIEVKNLSFKYQGTNKFVLKNINLSIKNGEIVILAGPSGCGKTTLARSLTGLIPQFYKGEYSGNVLVCGYDAAKTPIPDLATCIGYLFQNPDNQIIMDTVERDIAFSLEYRGFTREEMRNRITKILKTLGIEHLVNRKIDTLSGGEKQLVALAGVLVMEPKMLLLDEVSAYLSPRSLKRLISIIKSLNKEYGTGIMLIDHRLDLFVKLADRVIIMYDGIIYQDGDPQTIFKNLINKKLGINIPTTVKIYERLYLRGIRLDKIPLDHIELADIIN